jgi:hypothetical protein
VDFGAWWKVEHSPALKNPHFVTWNKVISIMELVRDHIRIDEEMELL